MADRTVFQPTLFGNDGGIDVQAVFARLEESTQIFFTRSEVASITGRSFSEIRQAIDKMQLDALFVEECYKISAVSIRDWAVNYESYEYLYDTFSGLMHQREVPNAYSVWKLYKSGDIDFNQAKTLIGPYVGKELLQEILDKDFNQYNDNASVFEDNLEDWYNLSDIDLPDSETVEGWAQILRVSPVYLKKDGSFSLNKPVSREDFINYLIKKEVVNLYVFENKPSLRVQRMQALNVPESIQPSLF